MSETGPHATSAVQSRSWVTRSPIFYGWIILVAGTLGLVMSSPGQTFAIAVFTEHFIADLGISRSLVSALYTFGTLAITLPMPFVGRQIDRYGSRRMFTIISALFGLSCVYMGTVRSAFMLGVGFVAIRMLGHGGLVLASMTVINRWWVRRRGTMVGIAGMCMGLIGMGAFPNLVNGMIPTLGWRLTYILFGLVILFVTTPLGFLLLRDRPEDHGLQPDGKGRRSAEGTVVSVEPEEEHWTLGEAVRTPAFWAVALGCGSMWMMSTGLYFHMVSIFADNNLSPALAASTFIPIALSNALFNLVSGLLLDRLPVRILVVAALVLQALSLIVVQFSRGVEVAYLYGVIQGATNGLSGTVIGVVWATYFGRRHLGSIAGAASIILSTGSALGPMPLGIARDLLGSYNLALTVSATLPLLLAAVNLFVRRPRRRDHVRG